MNNFDGYKILELIAENEKTQIFRALDKSHQSVILKILRHECIDADKIAQFKHEYELGSLIHSEKVVKFLELTSYNDIPVIVQKDTKGISLKKYLAEYDFEAMDLTTLLRIAIQITRAVSDIHEENVIHKDINPSNIIIHPQTKKIWVIDFGLATKLSFEKYEIDNYNSIEGTLPYISPEQTGRMNRNLDYRTDYYSLGISLYELFTGQLPFSANSSREWVHCHIAKSPASPHDINPSIPVVLSEIIMKLIEKSAESRYQSSFGIISDLEYCLNNPYSLFASEKWVIGKSDVQSKFKFPQKLYGREDEINILDDSFKQLSFYNKSMLVLLQGQAGIGKTSLVGEIQKVITERNSYFISGKFEKYKQDIPYYAFIQAFNQLITYMMSESEQVLSNWRIKIIEALSTNAWLVTNVVPNLERIIGVQEESQTYSAQEAHNCFVLTIQRFVQVFIESEYPLVMFLDDVQWIDLASLELLKDLLLTTKQGAFMCICSYRDNEMTDAHPFHLTKKTIKSSGVNTVELKVSPLKESDINHLLRDAFARGDSENSELAKICLNKTEGNPIFLSEFLTDLCKQKIIAFDVKKGIWFWDIKAIQQMQVTTNVADLITQRILSLSKETLDILTTASCIGSTFDLSTLALVLQKTRQEVLDAIAEALQEAYILPLNDNFRYAGFTEQEIKFRFVHDKVLQSVYSLPDEEDLKLIHSKIGIRLLEKFAEQITELVPKLNTSLGESPTQGKMDNRLFEKKSNKGTIATMFTITDHVNKGLKYIDKTYYRTIAGLNLETGKHAKISGAFDAAGFYFKMALSLFEEHNWNTDYQFTFELHCQSAEVAYLSGDYDSMDKLLADVFEHSKDLLHRVRAHEILIQSFIARYKNVEAITETLDLLKKLGLSFPKKASKANLALELVKTKFVLSRVKNEQILSLPTMSNEHLLVALHVFGNIVSALFRSDSNLFVCTVFSFVRLNLKYGLSPNSPVTFITYGILQNAVSGVGHKGCEIAKIGLKLSENPSSHKFKAQATYMYNAGIRPWLEHLKKSTEALADTYAQALEVGDFEYAVSAIIAMFNYKFYSGCELGEMLLSLQKYRDSLMVYNQVISMSQLDVQIQAYHNFRVYTSVPDSLVGAYFNEKTALELHHREKDDTSLFNIYLFKLTVAYFFNQYESAYQHASCARKYVNGMMGLFPYVLFHYYESLVFLAKYRVSTKEVRMRLSVRIKKNIKLLRKTIKFSPVNFTSKLCLVEAEFYSVLNESEMAENLYDEAIKEAQENNFIQEQALANELTANHWINRGKKELAGIYVTNACKCYEIWGAIEKLNQFKIRYSEFFSATTIGATVGSMTRTHTTSVSELMSMDLDTLIAATKAISSEIKLNGLIDKTLRIILEHAGAQSCMLILKNKLDNQLEVIARGSIENFNVIIDNTVFRPDKMHLPLGVIQYVNRTTEVVVLDDAADKGIFLNDPYVQSNSLKSVIALPILNQGNLNGILYLENNLFSNVFTSDRVGVLSVLCTQLAVSLENALLYNTLEQKVVERTQEVVKQRDIIEKRNKDITSSIIYAKRIQDAILPSKEFVTQLFPSSFIFFKPRDVVSGDFYFVKQIQNYVYIVAADCTGHGVPGAFMSMLGITLLNEIVRLGSLGSTSQILEELRAKIKFSLQQTGQKNEAQDGMDIAVCALNLETNELNFSGANNPIWILRKNKSDESKCDFIILEPDHQPVGVYRKEMPFKDHRIQLQPDDVFYIFSDGYMSQFGGVKKQKFKTKYFKELIFKIYHLPMPEQFEILEMTFNAWKGSMPQTDDVLVVGVRI